MASGTVSADDCAKFDSNGNLVGSRCDQNAFLAASGSTGSEAISSTTAAPMITSVIRGGTLAVGDVIRIRAVIVHNGGFTVSPRLTLNIGGTAVINDMVLNAADSFSIVEADLIVSGTSQQLAYARIQRGNGATFAPLRGICSAAIANDISIRFDGRMATATTESVSVDWHFIDVVKRQVAQ
jgi:hypothetical protein